jgi:hypothetical protein
VVSIGRKSSALPKYSGSKIAAAASNPCPMTETKKSIAVFGRFIRLFSNRPAERLAETDGVLGPHPTATAAPLVGRSGLGSLALS